eukprot:NODE_2830_length_1112_cov_25.321731_g2594_i0.p1 GENE.NODE_2830_length_1112_cov_25.321731_g2594_i0~~NODE_2830_length_1112_cov_25.321731_g2594_i0.p1  ORF type:complete len:154 (+),score=26.67 NODE_2830_length_1112_cov_25.321731_g2594_i0:397-858(+)
MLDESNTDIGDAGAAALARALAMNSDLTCVDVSYCGLGVDGASALATMLQSNITLKEIDVSDVGYIITTCLTVKYLSLRTPLPLIAPRKGRGSSHQRHWWPFGVTTASPEPPAPSSPGHCAIPPIPAPLPLNLIHHQQPATSTRPAHHQDGDG